jgi:hypothetical protein
VDLHNFAKTGNRCVFPQPPKFIRCISPTATSAQLLRQFRKPKTEKPLSMINTDHRVFPIFYFFTNPIIMLPIPHFLYLLIHFTRQLPLSNHPITLFIVLSLLIYLNYKDYFDILNSSINRHNSYIWAPQVQNQLSSNTLTSPSASPI